CQIAKLLINCQQIQHTLCRMLFFTSSSIYYGYINICIYFIYPGVCRMSNDKHLSTNQFKGSGCIVEWFAFLNAGSFTMKIKFLHAKFLLCYNNTHFRSCAWFEKLISCKQLLIILMLIMFIKINRL